MPCHLCVCVVPKTISGVDTGPSLLWHDKKIKEKKHGIGLPPSYVFIWPMKDFLYVKGRTGYKYTF